MTENMAALREIVMFAALLQLSASYIPIDLPIPGLYQDAFDAWREQYNKEYASDEEYQKRLTVFMNNLIFIDNMSTKKLSYEMELNQFADLEFEEFKNIYLMEPQDCSATHKGIRKVQAGPKAPPPSIDWRDMGVVTPVKNQGSCGSCWSFSTTGCLESHHAIKTKQLISLSEQQLVDCAQNFNNHGCDGGLPSQAFEYVRYQGGLEPEADYPYLAHQEAKCKFNSSKVAATVSNVVNITQDDEDGIYTAVGTIGPVSIAFDVTAGFQLYKKGVYSSKFCHKDPQHVNHAVLVVGYNTTASGEPYFIVKNSWGASWGMEGYFWIERGKNMCGLADCASYPIV